VFLEKSRDQTATYTRILHETGASRDALTKVLTREKKKDFPRFRKSGTYAIRLSSGLARSRDLNWDTMKLPTRKHKFLLPKPLRGVIGPEDGISNNVFGTVAAGPDSYKTGLLLDIAKENARNGARVLFLNHETDDARMACLLAQREANRQLTPEKAIEVCRKTPWIRDNLVVRSTHEVQIEELDLTGFDVLIWDYLSASFLRADSQPGQGSHYSKFVQLIGQYVVDKGIPVFCAVQKHWGDNGVKSTWFERSTIVLVVDDITRNPEGLDHVVWEIVKNKESGHHDYIDAEFDNYLGTLSAADPLSKQDYKIRQEEAKAEAKKAKAERDKEQEEIDAREAQEEAEQRFREGRETRSDKWKKTRAENKAKALDDDSIDWEEDDLPALPKGTKPAHVDPALDFNFEEDE
jgi:hypothetical protein